MIPGDVKKTIADLMMRSGLASDEVILYNNISFSGMPQDDFVTSAFVRKAKIEADETPFKYRCIGCGKYYQIRTDVVDCLQSHIKNFMIGEPVEREPEFEEEYIDNLPPTLRKIYVEQKEEESEGEDSQSH